MGTLEVNQKKVKPTARKNSREIASLKKSNSSTKMSNLEDKDIKKMEKKLEKEATRIRWNFEEVRQAFRNAEDAGTHDDIYFRLRQLEKATKRVRRGGFFGHGAKYHHKLLKKLKKSSIE